jgi:shikimate dehydrogenase
MSDTLFPDFLDNSVTMTTAKYAAILGLAPSKGARSPTLWNAAFAAAGLDAVMCPFDVTEANLAGLVAALKADPRYIGGSVAMPHKQGLVPLLDRLEPEAERIGAVNAIYRDGDDLVGANTDGAGAGRGLSRGQCCLATSREPNHRDGGHVRGASGRQGAWCAPAAILR